MNKLEAAKTCFLNALEEYKAENFSSAEALLRQALELAPDRVSILTNLSAVLLKLDQPVEAKEHADRSVEVDPENAEGWLNLGNALSRLERHEEALAGYLRAVTLNPDYAEAWSNCGTALNELKRHDEALASYDRALALNPDHAEAWYNRGNTLTKLKRHDEALASYDRAVQLNPNNAEAWLNRGIALNELKHHDEALASYDRAIAINPGYAEAWSNRGNTLLHLSRHDKALTCFDRAIAIQPDFAQAHFNESICRLSAGDFARGWEKYAWRWETGQFDQKPALEIPVWDGRPLEGALLAWGEQGLGDQILHMGMLKQVGDRVQQIVLAIEPRLVTLAQRSFSDLKVVSRTETLPEQQCAAWIPLADLGRHVRNAWADFPPDVCPYLLADPERTVRLREKLTRQHKFVCGLSWVSKNARFGDHKSIRLQDLLEILRIPGIEFVDLQYGDTRAEREAVQASEGVSLTRLDEIDNTHDIDGLAALIRSCDAVVTISNTTAHLAGALGTPLYLMLPRSLGRIWYWHEERGDSPWYPGARLFRQPQPDDWGTVIRDVAREIRNQVTPSLP